MLKIDKGEVMATNITYKVYDLDKLPLFKEYINHSDIKQRCFKAKGLLYVPEGIANKVSMEMRND